MIKISDTLRIRKFDKRNLVLEEYTGVTDRETGELVYSWENRGYYTTLRNALIGVFDKRLCSSAELKLEIKDLTKQIDMAKQEILDAISANK